MFLEIWALSAPSSLEWDDLQLDLIATSMLCAHTAVHRTMVRMSRRLERITSAAAGRVQRFPDAALSLVSSQLHCRNNACSLRLPRARCRRHLCSTRPEPGLVPTTDPTSSMDGYAKAYPHTSSPILNDEHISNHRDYIATQLVRLAVVFRREAILQ